MDWAVAQEGALKLKEISYIHAEAYAAGELKHGTLALISDETPVISVALQQKTFDKTMSNTEEMISRMVDENGDVSGAKVLAVVQSSRRPPWPPSRTSAPRSITLSRSQSARISSLQFSQPSRCSSSPTSPPSCAVATSTNLATSPRASQ